MTSDEFAKIGNQITLSTAQFIVGRVNVNTASAAVLAALPGIISSPDLAQTLVITAKPIRQTHHGGMGKRTRWARTTKQFLVRFRLSTAITTQSYQFTADIAALGPNGRGYRRVRFVFDTADGSPKIIYRQDLTPLGLGAGQRRSAKNGSWPRLHHEKSPANRSVETAHLDSLLGLVLDGSRWKGRSSAG